MKNKNQLRELLTRIFEYEYNSGIYGLEVSSYTSDIIEAEVKQILKHKSEINRDKVYVYIKESRKSVLREYSTYEEAVRSIQNIFSDVYIIVDGTVTIPMNISGTIVAKDICYSWR